jgi:hypothetical protein
MTPEQPGFFSWALAGRTRPATLATARIKEVMDRPGPAWTTCSTLDTVWISWSTKVRAIRPNAEEGRLKRLMLALLFTTTGSALAVASALGWASGTVTAPVGQATFVMSNDSFHVGANASSVRRGLVGFNLSAIPAHAQVSSATLSVYETITLRGSGTVGVRRVTTPWVEGTGSNSCTNNGATWTATGTGTNWVTPGSDFTASDIATVTKTAGDTPGWDRFDITQLVRSWVAHAYPNDGVVLKLDDESSSPCSTATNCNYWAYASNDYSDATLRPKLTITYR